MAEARLVLALLLGVLLLSAGVTKIRSGGFARDLANYRLLPRAVVPLVAATLPVIEATVGILLVVGLWPRLALLVAAVLLLLFAAAMAVNLLRGRRIRCGCAGSNRTISWLLVCRNIVLVSCE